MMVDNFNVDLDGHNGLTMMRSYYNARLFGEAQVYYTRHGFHLVVTLWRPMDAWDSLEVRLFVGDDPMRVELDREALEDEDYRAFDRLFEGRVKGGVKYDRWPFDVVRKNGN